MTGLHLSLQNSQFFRCLARCLTLCTFMTAHLLQATETSSSDPEFEKRPLNVGVFYKHPPYSYRDDNQQIRGTIVDYFSSLAFTATPPSFASIPHERLIQNLYSGDIDVSVLLVIPGELTLPKLDSLIVSRKPIFRVPMYLYSSKPLKPEQQLPDTFSAVAELENLRIGFVRSGPSRIHTSLDQIDHISLYTNYESLVKSLLSGRIDLAGIDSTTADYWNQTLNIKLHQLKKLLDIPIHMALSKASLGDQAMPLCSQAIAKHIALGPQLSRLYPRNHQTGSDTHTSPYCTTLRLLLEDNAIADRPPNNPPSADR